MKKLIFFLLILFISKSIQAQEWTWMKGTDTLTKPGIYGTMGVASPSNNPGARHGAATWVDNNGDLWLFGGEGVTTNTVLSWLNDLWKYTVSTGNRTWMGGTNLPNQNGIYGTLGVPSTTNMPGAREVHDVLDGCQWKFFARLPDRTSPLLRAALPGYLPRPGACPALRGTYPQLALKP